MINTSFGTWLVDATTKLKYAGISTARLDALLLAEHVTHKRREDLLANQDFRIKPKQLTELNKLLKRRINREPIAYITQKIEFYGREFLVNESVLIPRPESEDMIELLKKLHLKKSQLADIGTGSGCLAIAAKLELPSAQVLALDIDQKCLNLARQNAKKHKAQIKLLQGNLLGPLTASQSKLTAILANLPYVPAKLLTQPELEYEPKIALEGMGSDGMDVYRQFWLQVSKLKFKPKFIITESLKIQHLAMLQLANNCGYRQSDSLNLAQLFIIN